MDKFTIGIDFGTLSARAVLMNAATGAEVASSELLYPHGVMDRCLPCGTPLSAGSALQHPADYIEALRHTVSAVLKGISPDQVAGICVDFTACTALPVDASLQPLCLKEAFSSDPYAYVAMWKHRGAEDQAARITALAQQTHQPWLGALGGKVSAEWMLSKLLALREQSPELYRNTVYYLEAGDWLVWLLTGKHVRSSCMAGFKGLWTKAAGYPDSAFLSAVHPDFAALPDTLLSGEVRAPGTLAGYLNTYGADLLGLPEGTAVAVSMIDGHAGLPALGVAESGHLMLTIGTSSCHIVLDEVDQEIPGICGKVPDGILPGFVAYEAGQVCVGDMFNWFIENALPASFTEAARAEGISVFDLLEQRANTILPGQSRLLALDWWNGNRSPYADYTLTGAIFGYTIGTRPEEVYRALIEATAFGTRRILELYEQHGIHIHRISAGGGIAQKNRLLMQIYADVTGKEIEVTRRTQAAAAGSAILAASAAGIYPDAVTAVKALTVPAAAVYRPDPHNTAAYESLYQRYRTLSEHFANAPH